MTDGLPFVLPPLRPANFKEQILTDANVAPYVGDYALPDGRTLTIRFPKLPRGMHAMLEAKVAGVAPAPLLQNGKDRFYAPTSDPNVTFDKSGLTLTGADGGTLRAERAKAPRSADDACNINLSAWSGACVRQVRFRARTQRLLSPRLVPHNARLADRGRPPSGKRCSQISSCSDKARASSTSIPRSRTVLSSFR